MADGLRLELELLDFWHCGSGKGSGDFLDARADRDAAGLPFVPGRLLKGLLREALARCEAYGHVAPGSTGALFGAALAEAGEALEPGSLRVSDARLPEALRVWLRTPDSVLYRQALSRELYAPAAGSARGRQGLEAIVPVSLEAELRSLGDPAPPPDWRERIALALPLVGALGAGRSRGLGRCTLRIREEG
jgi:hypothetical protein